MAARSTNTFGEVLQRLLADIAQAMALPDADLEFLAEMQGMVTTKLRAPQQQMMDAGMLPPDGAPNGMPAGMPGGAPPLPPGGGFMTQPAAPNADELRRLMSQG